MQLITDDCDCGIIEMQIMMIHFLVCGFCAQITPFYGNPDIFVNPCSKGFYRSGSGVAATWQSVETRGSDAIFIQHSHPDFQAAGGSYCVTVSGAVSSGSSEFLILGRDAATVMRLAEGVPVTDVVSGTYIHPTQESRSDLTCRLI
jgi:hypothetical protein